MFYEHFKILSIFCYNLHPSLGNTLLPNPHILYRLATHSSCFLLREHFICSVCLDVFSSPVTIPCGHNFCQGCIQAYWNKGECSCPLCTRQFIQRPELAMNHVLDALSNTFRLEEPHPEPAKICIPPRKMAGKFTAIPEDLAQPRDALICPQCDSLGHKTHKTTPAEEQIPQIKTSIKKTPLPCQISARLQKQEQQTYFTMLISAVTEGQKRLMASMEEKQKEMLLKAESEVQKMEKRFKSLEDEVTGMELTLQGEEPGRLLQVNLHFVSTNNCQLEPKRHVNSGR
uniref:RING-type domain-containing protein n=1 Tax=Hucho hucho TaxID=62062 RepID=A0A4W5LHF6_9TELE